LFWILLNVIIMLENFLTKVEESAIESPQLKEDVMRKQLNLLIFKDCDDWWAAQCLEYDIAAQARTLKDVEYEIQRVIIGRIAAAIELKIDPFEDLSPAPEEYRRIFENTEKTLRVELKPIKNFPEYIFHEMFMPKEVMLYAG